MSKHWNPKVHQGGRPARYRPRRGGYRGGGGTRIRWNDLWQMLLLGLAMGFAWLSYSGGEMAMPGTGVAQPTAFAGIGGDVEMAADPAFVSITDGDTFRYRGERIRIADIDTPEVNGRCAYESALAARATARMEELLNQGPFELRAIDRDEDRYGRKLRIVTRGGHSLGDQLVAEGLARTWTGRREPWC